MDCADNVFRRQQERHDFNLMHEPNNNRIVRNKTYALLFAANDVSDVIE